MRKTPLAIWLFFPLVLFAFVASAQTLPLNLEMELGYRWTSIDGNSDLYRSQVNERDGFVLRALSLYTTGGGAATDWLRVDAADLGTSPAGTLKLDTGKNGVYRVRFGYRSFQSFRALPAFANPLLGQGIIPGQHTFDRDRQMFDADVEFLSFNKFTPFVGYSYGRNHGPGTTTYTLGGDEFLLGSNVDERDREIRVGTAFSLGKFNGSVTQGWRSLSNKEDVTLINGSGNNSNTILDKPLNATALTRSSRTDVDAPFTNLYVVGDVIPRTKLIGTYVRIGADADSVEDEAATGSFVSFGLNRFFSGVTETVGSNAKNDTWRGGLRAEVTITDAVTFLANYENEQREIGGTALIETLLSNTITFGGISTGTLQEIIDADSALDRKEETFSAGFTARPFAPFSVRAEARRTSLEYGVRPDISEIVVPGNQGSTHDRKVDTFEVAGTYAKSLYSLGASYRLDKGDREILRTDFSDRNRLRVRAAFHTPNNLLRLGLTGERGSQENDRADAAFDAGSRLYTGDIEVEPAKFVRFRGSYSRINADSRIITRRPETFGSDLSLQNEKGKAIEGGVALFFNPFTVDASVSRFTNKGTLPFDYDRYRIRATYDFAARFGVAAEWSSDDYQETAVFGQYTAERYGLFLRLRP
jgi:hypothetical protein